LLFAQSPKKINKRLRADIQRISEQLDSLQQVYQMKAPIYRSYRDSIRTDRRALGRFAEEQRFLWPIVDQVFAELKILGEAQAFEQGFIDLSSQKGNFSDSLIEKVAYFAPNFRFVEPIPSEQMSYINSLSLEEQNKALEDYKGSALENRTIAFGVFENVTNLSEIAPEILSELRDLIGFHKVFTERLFQFRRLITEHKENLKQTFCAKGPKGFATEYQEIFPECFPVKKPKETKVELVEEPVRTDLIGEKHYGDMPMPEPRPQKNSSDIYEVVDEVAEFPGGIRAMRTFLMNNIRYPQNALDKEIQGKCYLKFVVNAEGKISDVFVMRGVPDCPECDTEAMRVVSMMPSWKPARVDGKLVNSYFTLPITFNLD
jgi:protein TonB